MKVHRLVLAGLAVATMVASSARGTAAQTSKVGTKNVKHVLLLSIDGMHAVDLYNCTHGINGANGGDPYCPNLAALTHTGINYVATVSSKPSDSFPGLAARDHAAQIGRAGIGTRSQKENGRPGKQRPLLIEPSFAGRLLELNRRENAGSLHTNGKQGRGIQTQSLEDRRRDLHSPHSFPHSLGLEA